MRLCAGASIVPVAVSLQCEAILSELAPREPLRFVRILLPIVDSNVATNSIGGSGYHNSSSSHSYCFRVRLLSLRALVSAIQHLTASQVLSHLDEIVRTCIPHISSVVVDIRQAVVLLMVEVYVVIGDAMFPFLSSLSIAHHKLLTIYINKRMQQQQQGEGSRNGLLT